MRFIFSPSIADSEKQYGRGHLHPPPPTSHLRCKSSILHHGDRILCSFLSFLLSKLRKQEREQGCKTEERQSRGNTQPSARRVSETEATLKTKQLSVDTVH